MNLEIWRGSEQDPPCPATVYDAGDVSAIVYDTHELAVEHARLVLASGKDMTDKARAGWTRQSNLPEGYRIVFASSPELEEQASMDMCRKLLDHLISVEGVEAQPMIFSDEERGWIPDNPGGGS